VLHLPHDLQIRRHSGTRVEAELDHASSSITSLP